jgi:hypothetical protein
VAIVVAVSTIDVDVVGSIVVGGIVDVDVGGMVSPS